MQATAGGRAAKPAYHVENVGQCVNVQATMLRKAKKAVAGRKARDHADHGVYPTVHLGGQLRPSKKLSKHAAALAAVAGEAPPPQLSLNAEVLKACKAEGTTPRELLALALSRNRLKRPPSGCFLQFGALLELDLSNNAVKQLPLALPPSLRTLDLSHNGIGSLDEGAGGLARCPRLLNLDVSFNQLTSLDGIEALPELRALCVSKNGLVRSDGSERLRKLERLDIRFNQLRGMSSLRLLSLNHALKAIWIAGNSDGQGREWSAHAHARTKLHHVSASLRWVDEKRVGPRSKSHSSAAGSEAPSALLSRKEVLQVVRACEQQDERLGSQLGVRQAANASSLRPPHSPSLIVETASPRWSTNSSLNDNSASDAPLGEPLAYKRWMDEQADEDITPAEASLGYGDYVARFYEGSISSRSGHSDRGVGGGGRSEHSVAESPRFDSDQMQGGGGWDQPPPGAGLEPYNGGDMYGMSGGQGAGAWATPISHAPESSGATEDVPQPSRHERSGARSPQRGDRGTARRAKSQQPPLPSGHGWGRAQRDTFLGKVQRDAAARVPIDFTKDTAKATSSSRLFRPSGRLHRHLPVEHGVYTSKSSKLHNRLSSSPTRGLEIHHSSHAPAQRSGGDEQDVSELVAAAQIAKQLQVARSGASQQRLEQSERNDASVPSLRHADSARRPENLRGLNVSHSKQGHMEYLRRSLQSRSRGGFESPTTFEAPPTMELLPDYPGAPMQRQIPEEREPAQSQHSMLQQGMASHLQTPTPPRVAVQRLAGPVSPPAAAVAAEQQQQPPEQLSFEEQGATTSTFVSQDLSFAQIRVQGARMTSQLEGLLKLKAALREEFS